MVKQDNSYKSILKGLSAFGGVQVFQILINLVRGKFVALILGPVGMGISALFTSTSNTIAQISTLGLNLSLVKETAARRDDPHSLSMVIRVASRIVNITAIIGALFTALFAPWLSRITFGDEQYTWQFVAMALMIYFSVAGSGKLGLLQGLHSIRILSKASLVGAVTGLVAGVPLYYFFGTRGIVPSMILVSLAFYIFYEAGLRKVRPEIETKFSWKRHKPLVKKMLSTGMVLLSSMIITTFCTYLINLYLRVAGGVETVGLYNAANSLTNQYSAVVFTAMSLDYFPRLAAVASDSAEMNRLVNRQGEVVSLIATPLLLLLIVLTPVVISVLLTESFAGVAPLIRWFAMSLSVKALAYPLGFIAFARDNKRLFFWLEAVICNVLYLLCSCVGFRVWGLMGIGYGVLVQNVLELVIYYVVNRQVYGCRFEMRTVCYYLLSMAVCGVTLLISLLMEGVIGYYLMAVIVMSTLAYSVYRLRIMLRKDKTSEGEDTDVNADVNADIDTDTGADRDSEDHSR